MPPAPVPSDEPSRLAALRGLGILDTPPDAEFDALVRAAALVCGVPIALLSLVDEQRLWFKANIGLPGVSETPRDMAFGGHTILLGELTEITDARADARLVEHPLVTGEPFIRFYAGTPLRLSDGSVVGTLCLLDRQPRQLDDAQRAILRDLAQAASGALEGWRARQLQQQMAASLAAESRRLQNLIESAHMGTWEWNVQTDEVRINERWAEMVGYRAEELAPLCGRIWQAHIHPDDLDRAVGFLADHLAGRTERYECEFRTRHRDGHFVWVLSRGALVTRTADGRPEWLFAQRMDISERKQQEEALRKSEEFLDRTGRTAGVGGWELDLLTDEMHWSAETKRLHGVAPDHRPTVASALAFYTPDAAGSVRAAMAHAAGTGEGFDLELRFVRADGHPLWVRLVGAAAFAGGRPIRLSGAIQDVTQRVHEREALRQANERIKLAADSGGIGIWDWDVVTDVMHWDRRMFELYGMAAQDGAASYDDWRRRLHPDDAAAVAAAVADNLLGLRPYDIEFRVVWDDNSLHHLRAAARVTRDAQGRPSRMIGVSWDVTQSRMLAAALTRQMEQLAEASERENAIFRNSPDVLSIIRVEEVGGETIFRFEALSPAFGRLSGWRAEDFIGRRLEECLPPEAAQSALAECRACIAQEETVAYSVTLATPKGQRECQGARTPIRHPTSGKIVRIVGAMHDVTERKRLEAAAHHGQKMEAIGRLAAGVAHDFNNILQSISGSLELIQDDLGTDTPAHLYSAVALRAARRGSHLTNHLLSYARQQTLHARLIELPGLLADIEILLGRTLGPKIAVSVRCDVAARTVRADPGQLQTALLNLAINAAHAMPRGGSLLIASLAYSEAGKNWVSISVSDTGIGMDEQTLARAVEPFFTTKGANGTGLGLSMVHGFAEQSGGRLRLSSVAGQGTTIELHLPSDVADEAVVVAPAVQKLPDRPCILLVDDDADVLVTTGAFLETAGFTTLRARNADQALALLADGTEIGAVVTDYAMPGMNGNDLITEARMTRPQLPAVIISGFTEMTGAQTVDEGIVTLHKPFQRGALTTALQRLLADQARKAGLLDRN